MSDLIDRQAAIDFIAAGHLVNPNEPRWSDNEVVNFLKSRPSAQRTGRWIVDDEFIDCSSCRAEKWSRTPYESLVKRFRFCPNCGAKMQEVEE